MNSNSTTNSVKTDSGRCSDIYTDEIKKQINTLILQMVSLVSCRG